MSSTYLRCGRIKTSTDTAITVFTRKVPVIEDSAERPRQTKLQKRIWKTSVTTYHSDVPTQNKTNNFTYQPDCFRASRRSRAYGSRKTLLQSISLDKNFENIYKQNIKTIKEQKTSKKSSIYANLYFAVLILLQCNWHLFQIRLRDIES